MSKRELEKIRKLMCTQKFDKIDAWYKVVKDEGHTFITHMYNNCQGLTLNSSSGKWQVIDWTLEAKLQEEPNVYDGIEEEVDPVLLAE